MSYTSRTDDPAYHDTAISWHGAGQGGFQRCRRCNRIIHPCDALCEPCQHEESDAENRMGELEEQMDARMTEAYIAWMHSDPLASMREHAEFMEKLIGGAK